MALDGGLKEGVVEGDGRAFCGEVEAEGAEKGEGEVEEGGGGRGEEEGGEGGAGEGGGLGEKVGVELVELGG